MLAAREDAQVEDVLRNLVVNALRRSHLSCGCVAGASLTRRRVVPRRGYKLTHLEPGQNARVLHPSIICTQSSAFKHFDNGGMHGGIKIMISLSLCNFVLF